MPERDTISGPAAAAEPLQSARPLLSEDEGGVALAVPVDGDDRPDGPGDRRGVARLWWYAEALGSTLWVVAACVVLALGFVMLLGLGLLSVSRLAGMSLPEVDDDPDRVEVVGLVLLLGYGLLAAATLAGPHALLRRLLPVRWHVHQARFTGALALPAVTALGVYGMVALHDLRGLGLFIGAGLSAARVIRGLPLEGDDDEAECMPAA